MTKWWYTTVRATWSLLHHTHGIVYCANCIGLDYRAHQNAALLLGICPCARHGVGVAVQGVSVGGDGNVGGCSGGSGCGGGCICGVGGGEFGGGVGGGGGVGVVFPLVNRGVTRLRESFLA